MADKRISDFNTLQSAQGTDLILVSSNSQTFNMTIETFQNATSEAAIASVSTQAAEIVAQATADADASADIAASAATLAQSSAQAAARDAATASSAADTATGAVLMANSAADAAEASKNTAATNANDARDYASQAANSAHSAQVLAGGASLSASRAATSETNAATSETNAAASADAAQDVLDSIPQDYTAMSKMVGNHESDLLNYNTYDILANATRNSATSSGITWTWNTDGSCTVTGTATALSSRLLIGGTDVLPAGIVPGNTYYVKYSGVVVYMQLNEYVNGTEIANLRIYSDTVVEVPANVTAVRIRLLVASGNTANETVNPVILTALTNNELAAAVSDIHDSAINMATAFRPAMASGDDFNDAKYLVPGQWRIPSMAVGQSLINRPVGFERSGLLTVMNTHNTNQVYQILMSNSFTYIWARQITADTRATPGWKIVANQRSGEYAWQNPGFLIHWPAEESRFMVDTVKNILDITIDDSKGWLAEDGNGNRVIPAAKIYEMWDWLHVQYPQYVDAGEIIGYSLNPDGTNYGPVKAYYIHPRMNYTSYSGNVVDITYQDLPTIYLTAGTHGAESTPTWTLFATFLRAFMTGTIYSEFLDGKKFRVVPVLDVWCYDHKARFLAAAYTEHSPDDPDYTPDEIYNANRQCICTDMTNPTYATLTLRNFASEAKALTDYMEAHDFGSVDGDCYIDMHNCSYSLGYLTTDNPKIASMYNEMVDTLAKDWLKNTTFINGDPVDYYASSTTDHTQQRGKILANPPIESSYAWFFGAAYPAYSSNILEVQQADSSSGTSYAFAKANDMTYRWFKTLFARAKEASLA